MGIEIALVFATNILGMISPGPDVFIVMRNALRDRFEVVIFTAVGIATGCLMHVGFAVFGLTILASTAETALQVIRFVGAGYLIWIGVGAVRVKAEKLPGSSFQGDSPREGDLVGGGAATSSSSRRREETSLGGFGERMRAYNEGLLCNILNVKAVIFFTSLFSQVITEGTATWVRLVYFLGIPAMAFVWFTLLARLLTLPFFQERLMRSQLLLTRVMGVFFILFAVLALALP